MEHACTPWRSILLGLAGAVLALAPSSEPRAQQVCRTANCAPVGSRPAQCENRAKPSIHPVQMLGMSLTFSPADPRIEPGDCIEWTSIGVFAHSSSDGQCPDSGTFCNTPSPAACLWDTGNVAPTDPSVTCHYAPANWPPATADPYFCRLHASPTVGTMRGTLRVTSAIVLSVSKDSVPGDIVLNWTGGGLPASEIFKVTRSDVPAFGTFTTTDPTGGATGRSYRDVGELASGIARYYLVRNRQQNE